MGKKWLLKKLLGYAVKRKTAGQDYNSESDKSGTASPQPRSSVDPTNAKLDVLL
jgi:hypothetical protein